MKQLLKFYAPWCKPCGILSKQMENLGPGAHPVMSINIDEETDQAVKYQIRGVPALVLLEDGKEIKRKAGIPSLAELKEFMGV